MIRRIRWEAVSGAVVLAYVVVFAMAVAGLGDRSRFDDQASLLGSLGGRVALVVVVLAVVFHTLDGLRRLLTEIAPATARHQTRVRAGVTFLTWALTVPAAAVLLWPWYEETFR